MKKIYILRHAKAEQTSKVDDHERPLSPQGFASCGAVAAYMQTHAIMPELILSSPSGRTKSTIEAVAQDFPSLTTSISFLPALYLASAGELFAIINKITEDVSSILVSGHNPGLHEFALLLSANSNNDFRFTLQEGLPTAGLVSFECAVNRWQDVEIGTAQITGFFKG